MEILFLLLLIYLTINIYQIYQFKKIYEKIYQIMEKQNGNYKV